MTLNGSSTLRFSAFQTHIASRKTMPIGRQRQPLEVVTLNDSWQSGEKQFHTTPIRFPSRSPKQPTTDYYRQRALYQDDSTLLTVPYPELFLHERGAYVLNQQLGLSIIPDTELADLQNQPGSGIYDIGSLQSGINGISLEKASPEQVQAAMAHPDRLIELYLYTVIANDADKCASRNVLIEKKTNYLYAIDNECSGADPHTAETIADLPKELLSFYTGQLIPAKYLKKLRLFVDQKAILAPELLAYYGPEAVEGMFNRAQLILKTGRLIPPADLQKKILACSPPLGSITEVSLPKAPSKPLWTNRVKSFFDGSLA